MRLQGFISKHKKLFMLVVLSCCIMIFISSINASAKEFSYKNPNTDVLLVYTTDSGKVNAEVRRLEMLLGHFTSHISIKKAEKVTKKDLSRDTSLFYYGGSQTQLPKRFRQLSNTFQGKFIAIGANVEQLGKSFSFVHPKSEATITHLTTVANKQKVTLPYSRSIKKLTVDQSAKVLMEGTNNKKTFPLFIQKQNRYYFASTNLYGLLSTFLGKGLHQVFSSNIEENHPAYIRLEDVSPKSDPEKLMAIAKYLKKKQIPYMIAVIPVYDDPEKDKIIHYSDKPKVLKALHYMQKNGGSVVMHGYKHQYYPNNKAGEGSEFWDIKNNTPILGPPNQKPKTKDNFEKKYTNQRLSKGIKELVDHNLHPLAFEAPHYNMSLEGYKTVSHYFSTYVGKIQLSDKSWKISGAPPYITRPSFLNDMLVLPETIGYVPMNQKNGIDKMMKKARKQLVIKNGVIGGFYHPFLGVNRLRQLVRQMEELPDLQWIDLKKMNNKVKDSDVTITSGEQGVDVHQSHTKPNASTFKLFVYHFKNIFIWGLAIMTIVGVLLAIFYNLYQKRRNKENKRS